MSAATGHRIRWILVWLLIAAWFVALALTLEGQGLLQYHPSKTPAECAREARLAGSDRERLRDLVRSLYSYAFGGRSIAPDDYRRWRENGAGPWHSPEHAPAH